MERVNLIEKCPITGLDAYIEKRADYFLYTINLLGNEINNLICKSCNPKIDAKYHYLFKGFLANKIIKSNAFLCNKSCTKEEYNNKVFVDELINTTYYPRLPNDKSDNLLQLLHAVQEYDGEYNIIGENTLEELTLKGYFKNIDETKFYLNNLNKSGFIEYFDETELGGSSATTLTVEGLQKIIEINENGNNSNLSFIAMAFREETRQYREAIKRALLMANFIPIIIDEAHVGSDKTIPDEIFNSIKKAKFCVADFSFHRNGVYFEAGYALGLGKPVIYCCHNNQFNESHFDIKQLQHIIYKDEKELEEKLFQKIEAWIEIHN